MQSDAESFAIHNLNITCISCFSDLDFILALIILLQIKNRQKQLS